MGRRTGPLGNARMSERCDFSESSAADTSSVAYQGPPADSDSDTEGMTADRAARAKEIRSKIALKERERAAEKVFKKPGKEVTKSRDAMRQAILAKRLKSALKDKGETVFQEGASSPSTSSQVNF